MAERFELHPNVARHHLEKLAAGGYLDVELDRHDSAGRPSKRYRAAADDNHLVFPPQRDDLLATLLARALERLPVDEARALAEEVGLRLRPVDRRADGADRRPPSVKAAVASVADALTAHGFAAHAEARGNLLTLVVRALPVRRGRASSTRTCCARSTPAWSGHARRPLRRDAADASTESRPDGDQHCVTRV